MEPGRGDVQPTIDFGKGCCYDEEAEEEEEEEEVCLVKWLLCEISFRRQILHALYSLLPVLQNSSGCNGCTQLHSYFPRWKTQWCVWFPGAPAVSTFSLAQSKLIVSWFPSFPPRYFLYPPPVCHWGTAEQVQEIYTINHDALSGRICFLFCLFFPSLHSLNLMYEPML